MVHSPVIWQHFRKITWQKRVYLCNLKRVIISLLRPPFWNLRALPTVIRQWCQLCEITSYGSTIKLLVLIELLYVAVFYLIVSLIKQFEACGLSLVENNFYSWGISSGHSFVGYEGIFEIGFVFNGWPEVQMGLLHWALMVKAYFLSKLS